jgi:hypothetical protein
MQVGLLKFVKLELGSRNCGLRPILLPTFFYAGQIRKVRAFSCGCACEWHQGCTAM